MLGCIAFNKPVIFIDIMIWQSTLLTSLEIELDIVYKRRQNI